MVEVPPSTVRFLGANFGVAGGGYLRHLPMWYTRAGIKRIHREHQPVNVYFHPWEIDPAQPRIGASWKSGLRHYRGLNTMELRLCRLLKENRFGPIVSYVRQWQQQRAVTAG
ncbi:MAG TPA: DUF3473 domain-containing protein, partial [Terriglobales bacterium]|nr:DUF3473 domain-containing protein [Terriglobales bacterium]